MEDLSDSVIHRGFLWHATHCLLCLIFHALLRLWTVILPRVCLSLSTCSAVPCCTLSSSSIRSFVRCRCRRWTPPPLFSRCALLPLAHQRQLWQDYAERQTMMRESHEQRASLRPIFGQNYICFQFQCGWYKWNVSSSWRYKTGLCSNPGWKRFYHYLIL